MGHEEVILVQDAAAGLRAVIALHDTTLGPAVGGTRMRVYPTLDEAMVDALRLARAMTYKAALAEMPRGGGKAVILGDPGRDKTRALLTAYARAQDRIMSLASGFQMHLVKPVDPLELVVAVSTLAVRRISV